MHPLSIRGKLIAGALAFAASLATAFAQSDFPSRSLTMLVGYAAGGTSDVSLRYLADSVSRRLGQPVVVVNRTGGGGMVALAELKRARPDGYTIGFLATGPIINMHLRKSSPIDAIKDFTPIILASSAINGFAVRSDSPFKTMKDWIDFAAKNPGKGSYATPGSGSPPHLVMLQLAEKAHLDLVHIPTAGGMPAVTLMLGGHVTGTSQATEWKPYVASGQARLLAMYGAKRYPDYPDVPTLVELGYDIVAPSVYSIVGPAGMPPAIVQKLQDAFHEATQEPGYQALLKRLDLQPDYADSEGLRKLILSVSDLAADALKNVPKED